LHTLKNSFFSQQNIYNKMDQTTTMIIIVAIIIIIVLLDSKREPYYNLFGQWVDGPFDESTDIVDMTTPLYASYKMSYPGWRGHGWPRYYYYYPRHYYWY